MRAMTRELITALACALPDEGAPAEIVFIPEGSHKLTPKSHPKGISVNVPAEQGEAIAAAFNRDLAKRGNVKAWFDFEHTRKFPASAYPTAFRYQAGVGVMAAVDWSQSGRTAVEGRDVRYFSPEFYIDKQGIPNGLPDRGPLGGLVTEPAFRDIPAIAASDSDPMTDLSHTVTDLKTRLTAAETERDALKAKVAAAEADAKKLAEARADDLVKAAIADGRIAAKDEKIQGFYRRLITAGDADAEEALGNLKPQHADLERPIITARDAAGRSPEDRVTAAQAKARAELGDSAEFSHVWARAAELDPAAFE